MTIASMEGFGNGFVDRQYPMSENGVAGLRGFYFGYGNGGSLTDNHLQMIMAIPGGNVTDLTPTADLAPTISPAGRAELGYRDHDHGSSRDRYFYSMAHSMLSSSQARRFTVRDLGDSGTVTRPLPAALFPVIPGIAEPIIALAGFKLHFTGNRDHHIDEITVMINDDRTYTIGFNDKNDDDVFAYEIHFVRIGSFFSTLLPGEMSGRAKGFSRIPHRLNTNMDFVLRGFSFNFVNADHHIREIGILIQGPRISVIYGDINGDDPFDFKVKWVEVGPRILAPIGGLATVG